MCHKCSFGFYYDDHSHTTNHQHNSEEEKSTTGKVMSQYSSETVVSSLAQPVKRTHKLLYSHFYKPWASSPVVILWRYIVPFGLGTTQSSEKNTSEKHKEHRREMKALISFSYNWAALDVLAVTLNGPLPGQDLEIHAGSQWRLLIRLLSNLEKTR